MNCPFATHEVFNQTPPLEDVNLFTTDRALMEAVEREGGGHAAEAADSLRRSLRAAPRLSSAAGSPTSIRRGLRTFDAKGRRLDMVEFHPAYHECMEISVGEGLHCSAWDHLANAGRPAGARRQRRALGRLLHGGPDGGRTPVPDHHDQRRGAGAAARAETRQGVGAEDPVARLRQELQAGRATSAASPSAWA